MRALGKFSIMLRLVVLFLAALMPLIALYVGTYQLSRDMLAQEAMSAIQRENQDFANRLQEELQRILTTNSMLASNWELGKLAVVPEDFTPFEQSRAIANIQDKIFLAQIGSRFIGAIHVYIPVIDKCISTNYTQATLNSMRLLADNIDYVAKDQFVTHAGQIVLISENTFRSGGLPSLVIQTVLNTTSVNELFNAPTSDETSAGFLFNVQSGNLLGGSEPGAREQALIERISSEILSAAARPSLSGTLDTQVGQARLKVSYAYLRNGDVALVRYFNPADIRIGFGQMQALLIAFAGVIAVAFLLIYYSLYRFVNRPLRKLLTAFEQVQQGDLSVSISARDQGEFQHIFDGFNAMVQRLSMLVDQTLRQKIHVQRAELKQLQAQIDPHFLYNGFFILNKRIRAQDKDGALAFSEALSEYFHYVTKNQLDVVSLIDEVNHAYNYARIQQVRFSNRLTLEFQPLPAPLERIATPRLILQPIYENVFRHVIDVTVEPLTLRVRYETDGQMLQIHVEDSGTTLTDESLEQLRCRLGEVDTGQEVSGLVNVHRRLQLFYGEAYGLRISRSKLGGLSATLCIDETRRGDEM